MGLFGALFGETKYRDTQTYAGDKAQRKQASGDLYDMQHNLMSQDPGTFWGQSYGDWGNRTGLGGLNPEGGLSWGNLVGGGGSGGGGGGVRAGHARAGHAHASLVDLADEAYQTKMRDDILQGFVGRHRAQAMGPVEQAIRESGTTAELSGLSPGARAYMALMARTNAADAVGNQAQEFETDAYRQALNRRNEALGLNAQLGTNVSVANAGYDTQASVANAGYDTSASAANASLGEARNAREAAAARFLLGMYDQGQDRDLQRYQLAHGMGMDLVDPRGQKTAIQTPGLLSQLGTIGASAMGIPGLGQGFGAFRKFMGGGGGGGLQPGMMY